MTYKLLLKTLLLAVCMETAALGDEELSMASATQEEITPLRKRSEFKKYFTGQKNEYQIPAFSVNSFSDKAISKSLFEPQSPDIANLVLAYVQKYHNDETLDLRSIIRDLNRLIEDGEVSNAALWSALLRMQAAQSGNISACEKDLFSHLTGLGSALDALTKDDAWKTQRSMSFNIFASLASSSKFAKSLSDIYPTSSFSSSKEIHYRAFESFRDELEVALSSMLSLLPVLDRGFVGFHFLIENLINDIFPISFPSVASKLSAHGIDNFSPLGFTLHDMAHIELYGKKNALRKYGAMLFQKLADEKIPYKQATRIVINRVMEQADLLKNTLIKALELIDQKAMSGEMSPADYAKALHGYFYLLHENPLFFDPLFECTTFSDLLMKMGKDDSFNSHEYEIKKPADFKFLNYFNTSHLDGTTSLSDQEMVAQIISDKSKFEPFKVNKFDSFDIADAIDQEKTKVHKTDSYIDIELHFENGNHVFFAFPTLRQNHTNVLHSLSSMTPFWGDAASIDKETTDQEIAYSNMARITSQVIQSTNYFLDQINTPELEAFYTDKFRGIQEAFDREVTAAKPAEMAMMPLHQEVAPSSSSYPYTPYVSEADTLRVENKLLRELLDQQKPNFSFKSNGPVEVNVTFGSGK